jgi:hypothetical protein
VAPFPSVADVGFLAAVPLAIAGLLSFWTAPRGTAERWHLWLDGMNIVLALTFTGWALGLQQVWLSGGSLAERVIGLAYPVGDILIATVLVLGIRRAATSTGECFFCSEASRQFQSRTALSPT